MTREYQDYLDGPLWKKRQLEKFQQAGKKCEACGANRRLHIHHLTYERIFQEPMEDLMVLCKRHHEDVEELFKKGVLKKTGEPEELRRSTLEELRREREGDIFWGMTCFTPREKVVETLLTHPLFLSILQNPRQKAANRIKEVSRRAGSLRLKFYQNALMTYDAFHGIGHYSKFRREVVAIAEKVDCRVKSQYRETTTDEEIQVVKNPNQKGLVENLTPERPNVNVGYLKTIADTVSERLYFKGIHTTEEEKWKLVAVLASWTSSVGGNVIHGKQFQVL